MAQVAYTIVVYTGGQHYILAMVESESGATDYIVVYILGRYVPPSNQEGRQTGETPGKEQHPKWNPSVSLQTCSVLC